jgi:hypothetical protein
VCAGLLTLDIARKPRGDRCRRRLLSGGLRQKFQMVLEDITLRNIR